VLFLNGSKVATSGTALTFDGTNLSGTGSIGTTIAGKTAQFDAAGGSIYASFADGTKTWRFGAGIISAGAISLYNATDAVTAFTVNATGNLGIGTTSPATKLNVVGTVTVDGVVDVNGGQIDLDTGQPIRWGGAASSIYAGSGTSDMVFTVGSSERFRVNGSSGNFGIGTSSPAQKLTVNGGLASIGPISALTASSTFLDYNTTSNTGRFAVVGNTTGTAAPIVFSQYSSNGSVGRDAVTIDSSGNLGLGVTPSAWGGATALQIGAQMSAAYVAGNAVIYNNAYYDGSTAKYISSTTASYYNQVSGSHRWAVAASGTAGNAVSFTEAMTLDASGNFLVGSTSSGGISGAAFKKGATTSCLIEISGDNGTPATDSLAVGQGADKAAYVYQRANKELIFGTNNTERARITGGGDLLVGTTTSLGKLTVEASSGNCRAVNVLTGASIMDQFYFNGTATGNISTNGVTAAYNTSSDRRLKDNISPADNAGAVIDAIEVVKHDWKVGGHTRYGMIAQDLHMVAPEAVSVGDDGEELKTPWGVDYSKLVPMLVKEIQSLRARVAQLESK
jgi:hypothetical protein